VRNASGSRKSQPIEKNLTGLPEEVSMNTNKTRIILRRSFVNIARRLLTRANIFARALTSCRENLRGEANPTCNSPYRLTFSQPTPFALTGTD
jgi:hypothetical protein